MSEKRMTDDVWDALRLEHARSGSVSGDLLDRTYTAAADFRAELERVKAELKGTQAAQSALIDSRNDWKKRATAAEAKAEALAKFKAYVHARLDAAGVPVDPESPHKAEGCRIGGRLDWFIAERNEQAKALAAAEARERALEPKIKAAETLWRAAWEARALLLQYAERVRPKPSKRVLFARDALSIALKRVEKDFHAALTPPAAEEEEPPIDTRPSDEDAARREDEMDRRRERDRERED